MIDPEPNCLWMARIASPMLLFLLSFDMRRAFIKPRAAGNCADLLARLSR
jgi:hypothetical protein